MTSARFFTLLGVLSVIEANQAPFQSLWITVAVMLVNLGTYGLFTLMFPKHE